MRIEKKIFELADKVVLMKSSMDHQKKYNMEYSSKMEFLDIPMLKLNKQPSQFKRDNSQIKFLFVGSIAYKIRNPQILIDALTALDREDIVCEFVGNIDCKECFGKLQEKMGDRLKFVGFMKHDELAGKFASADVLLNIGNLISTMVPSKIFEYMSYKKPIISTYSIKNEPSKKYLEKYPMALLLSGDKSAEANAKEIDNFINNSIHQKINSAELEEKFFLNMPKTFVEYIVDNR